MSRVAITVTLVTAVWLGTLVTVLVSRVPKPPPQPISIITKAMVEGMLVEPWRLIGYQERRLREFLELLQLGEGHDLRLATFALRRLGPHPSDRAALS